MRQYIIVVKLSKFSEHGTSSVMYKGANSLEEARSKIEELKNKYLDHVKSTEIYQRVE